MKIENLNKEIWSEISSVRANQLGYFGTFITLEDEKRQEILIFKDETDKKHLVIDLNNLQTLELPELNINGLTVSIKQFSFNGEKVKKFIDLECSLEYYIDEFTEIIKEIAKEVLSSNINPQIIVITILQNWKSFWSTKVKEILSEEDQIGLLCELIILKRLCEINPSLALASWKGPLKEKYDFIFSDWAFEIKGTRRSNHAHIINGIEQLKTPINKQLLFISFLLTSSLSSNSNSIESLIFSIIAGPLKNKSALIQDFYSLLISAGYSKVFSEEYKKIKFEVIECCFYNVDNSFPKFTQENLKEPLSNRISEIRYKIDLAGLNSTDIQNVNLGNYFF